MQNDAGAAEAIAGSAPVSAATRDFSEPMRLRLTGTR